MEVAKTRDEAVAIAQRVWSASQPLGQAKRQNNLNDPPYPSKRGRNDTSPLQGRPPSRSYQQEKANQPGSSTGSHRHILSYPIERRALRSSTGTNRRNGYEKRGRAVDSATSPAPWPYVRIKSRFHTPAVVAGSIQTNIDLDTGAECDLVSIEFVRKHNFHPAKASAPRLGAVGELRCPTYGCYTVPIVLTDSRGTIRRFERVCIAVERRLTPGSSPVLLSMTFFADVGVHIYIHDSTSFWFEVNSRTVQLVSARQFEKEVRNCAYVYVVVRLPEEV
ncbi:hypothetical protein N7470_000592 [Penicillium chermesinum]|nr:hypothetical protein N7470_000592 [Penicillium chermesinum]